VLAEEISPASAPTAGSKLNKMLTVLARVRLMARISSVYAMQMPSAADGKTETAAGATRSGRAASVHGNSMPGSRQVNAMRCIAFWMRLRRPYPIDQRGSLGTCRLPPSGD
jgi:hypothetical protein